MSRSKATDYKQDKQLSSADSGKTRQSLQPPRNKFKGVVPSHFLGRYLF